jgi:hypothetical protein
MMMTSRTSGVLAVDSDMSNSGSDERGIGAHRAESSQNVPATMPEDQEALTLRFLNNNNPMKEKIPPTTR